MAAPVVAGDKSRQLAGLVRPGACVDGEALGRFFCCLDFDVVCPMERQYDPIIEKLCRPERQ